jgi:hypothetical protein
MSPTRHTALEIPHAGEDARAPRKQGEAQDTTTQRESDLLEEAKRDRQAPARVQEGSAHGLLHEPAPFEAL